ncbi:MAG: C10 family peptidase [Muribaculaceae bacterium]|nr:C10 family peptidase [Muribaculaceae bacterium]
MKRTFFFKTLSFFGLMLMCACEYQTIDMNDISDDVACKTPEMSDKYLSCVNAAKAEVEKLIGDLNASTGTRTDENTREIEDAYIVYDSQEDAEETRTDYETSEGRAALCIVNFKQNHGFAILSVDSIEPELYGFSLEGRLDQGQTITNPGMIQLMEYLKFYIDGNEPSPDYPLYPRNDIVVSDWENTFYYPDGLCDVKWHQDAPYNKFCIDKAGNICPTGCTTTAVAQFMAANEYPSSYKQYTFDWDEMKKFPKAYLCSENARISIARLMQQLGTSNNLNVEYGVKGSGAFIDNVPRTLKNFGYSNSGKVIYYDDNKVIDELIKGHCVIMRGADFKETHRTLFGWIIVKTIYSAGHTWLGHGLLKRSKTVKEYHWSSGELLSSQTIEDWYILCNWGYGGSHCGYYKSGIFNTAQRLKEEDITRSSIEGEEGNYQFQVKAVINVRK